MFDCPIDIYQPDIRPRSILCSQERVCKYRGSQPENFMILFRTTGIFVYVLGLLHTTFTYTYQSYQSFYVPNMVILLHSLGYLNGFLEVFVNSMRIYSGNPG
jgi:hypothetical protein